MECHHILEEVDKFLISSNREEGSREEVVIGKTYHQFPTACDRGGGVEFTIFSMDEGGGWLSGHKMALRLFNRIGR